jgi:hypothetical protein
MRFLAILIFCTPLFAQSFLIVPSTAPRGGAGSLLITLISAGKEPVALQWKMMLGTEVTAAVEDIVAGDAAKTAGKAVVCAPVTAPEQEGLTYNCILAGGQKPIANGTIFLVKYRVKQKASPQTAVIRISDGIAVLEQSNQVQQKNLAPAEGTITIR